MRNKRKKGRKDWEGQRTQGRHEEGRKMEQHVKGWKENRTMLEGKEMKEISLERFKNVEERKEGLLSIRKGRSECGTLSRKNRESRRRKE